VYYTALFTFLRADNKCVRIPIYATLGTFVTDDMANCVKDPR
jgi:hypothetical protein